MRQESETSRRIRTLLGTIAPMTPRDLKQALPGVDPQAINSELSRLYRQGRVRRVGAGTK